MTRPSVRFWSRVTNDGRARCAFATPGRPYGQCSGIIEAHHVIPKQRIKRAIWSEPEREQAVWDPRNGMPVCQKHHHQITVARIQVPKELVPAQTILFARQHGLEWSLERDINSED